LIAVNLIPGPRRTCKRCSVRHPLDFYSRAPGCADGRRPVCKNCMSADDRDRYQENREARIEKQQRYYKENADRIRAHHRWRYHNDSSFGYMDPDLRVVQRNEWRLRRQNNPVTKLADYIRIRLRRTFRGKGHNRRSDLYGRLGYTQSELRGHLRSYLALPCEVCGIPLTRDNAEIDHVVPLHTAQTEADVWALNTLGNLRMICGPCNRNGRPREVRDHGP
jgi:hypothetical protein